jgi:hypothetical protein
VATTYIFRYTAGDTVPNTGRYINTATGRAFWLNKDTLFPPTPMQGQTYQAVVVTART